MMLRNLLNLRSFLIAYSFFALCSLDPRPAAGSLTQERYSGVARDQNGQIVYVEKHEVEYQSGRVRKALTRYLSPDGKLVAELTSEFPGTSFLPKYRFKNLLTSIEEGVDCCLGEELEVFHGNKRKRLKFGSGWVSGQGFHYLAKERLEKVDHGENQQFKFLIPAKLDIYDFRIRTGGRDPKNQDHERILLEIDQWFFRLFAPKIVAVYDMKTRRLIRYEGLSNIEDKNGRIQKVTIDYTYEP